MNAILEFIAEVVIFIAFVNLFIEFLSAYLFYPLFYKRYGWLKAYYHDQLGRHLPEDGTILVARGERHAICKYCGKGIKEDFYGDWE